MSATLSPIKLTHGTILSDEVYSCIGAAILDGRLRPGQRLRDVDLAAELGISRTPVREALQRLERGRKRTKAFPATARAKQASCPPGDEAMTRRRGG